MMRTYYRGSDALVTDDYFVWRTSSTRFFAVGELRNIVIVRGSVSTPSQGPALAATMGVLMLAAASWFVMGPTVGYPAAAAAIVISLMILSLNGRRSTRPWHLLASYRGGVVTLYSSPDVRVFNQVTRALRRSTENLHAARGREDLATA